MVIPAHILIVDDEPEICDLLRDFLTYRGYTVTTALSGKEALERIAERGWDLVICDLKLGDLSGFDVLRETKRQDPTSEFILITGYGSVEHTITAVDLGVSAYLQKPITLFSEFDVRVEEALSKRSFSLKTKRLLEGTDTLDDTVRQHVKRMEAFSSFSRSLLSTIEYLDVIQQVMHGLMVIFNPQGGFIYLASDDEAMFYAHTCRPVISEVTENVLDRILAYWGQFSIAPPSANRVTIISSHERDEMSLEQTYGRIDPLCIPLAVQNRIMGVLSIDGVPDQSDRNDLTALLYIVGGQAASAIDRASQHHHVKSLSLTDWLTRLLNRRALHDRLQQEFDRARRYRSSLSLIMLDIDYFKKVNDTYGHQQGDAILRGLAGILIEESRRSDILARYGGEEFIIVLPETTLTNARQLAERLRIRVESHSFQLPMGQSLKITISLGVAALPHTGVNDEESLIREADLALYRAKGEGRNRVCTIDEK